MINYAAIEWCEWCVADSGRTHATRLCCIARRVSKMMPHARSQALKGDDGPSLRTAALRSISMRICKLARPERMEAYRHALRDGWLPQDIEVLKRFAREEFNRGQADGV